MTDKQIYMLKGVLKVSLSKILAELHFKSLMLAMHGKAMLVK